MIVQIRRHWNDWRIGTCELDDLSDLHWTDTSGGVCCRAPQPFIHAYIWCNKIAGEVAHSCAHGDGPHNIKVCIVKKDNSPEIYTELLAIAGDKPQKQRNGSSPARES